ncbi:MAG: FtsX-like permease family protein [Elusimicrobiota bacterium]
MNIIIEISLRNLLRQKRRNLLLGLAIAFGMMILVIANSFSRGITDNLLNKIIVMTSGHITLGFQERGRAQCQIFRDRERVLEIINHTIPDYDTLSESLGTFARAIGNGKSDNIIVVGIDTKQKMDTKKRKVLDESYKIVAGEFDRIDDETVENPIVISDEKAKYLNVTLNDTIRIRYPNVFNQPQAARLTVVGIIHNDNVFMSSAMLMNLQKLKALMGYKTWETGDINIVVKEPRKTAILYANKLHEALKPGLAVIHGIGRSEGVTMLGFRTSSDTVKMLSDKVPLIRGDKESAWGKDEVVVTSAAAKKFSTNSGGTIEFTYQPKFGDKPVAVKCKVTAVADDKTFDGKPVILVNDKEFYSAYYDNLPSTMVPTGTTAYYPATTNPIYPALATEWIMLDRSKTTQEMQLKMKDVIKKKWKATLIDVRTMYESASAVLQLEAVLNIITLSAVMVLFFIILIGVINTLRMTIRERTREIGTIRAIGMRKKDVRNTFILETFFLSLFSCITGIIAGFIAMWLLSLLTFSIKDNPMMMLLINGHLYFKPHVGGILSNTVLILIISVATAYFPAKRAANLVPSDALRHYE